MYDVCIVTGRGGIHACEGERTDLPVVLAWEKKGSFEFYFPEDETGGFVDFVKTKGARSDCVI